MQNILVHLLQPFMSIITYGAIAPLFFLFVFFTNWGFLILIGMGILGYIMKKHMLFHLSSLPFLLSGGIAIGYGYFWQWSIQDDAKKYPQMPCKMLCDPTSNLVISMGIGVVSYVASIFIWYLVATLTQNKKKKEIPFPMIIACLIPLLSTLAIYIISITLF